jgi:hypothetical protein
MLWIRVEKIAQEILILVSKDHEVMALSLRFSHFASGDRAGIELVDGHTY